MLMRRTTFLRTAAALAPAAATTGVAVAQSATPIRLTSSLGDDVRPLLYALDAGLFKSAGLDVRFQLATSGGSAAQAVVAGAMDIGKSSITAAITAFARGIPVVLVAPSLVYRKDAITAGVVVPPNSPLKTARDLSGKTIATGVLGAIGDLGLRAMIDRQGGDSSTVKWLEMPTAAVNQAVEQGRADAGIGQDPFMTTDVKAGKLRFLLDFFQGYPRPVLISCYFAMRDFVNRNRDAVERFGKVIHDANQYANTHDAQTLPLLISVAKMDPQAAAQMQPTYSALTFDPAQIQPVIDVCAKYKVIPKGFDARDLVVR